MNGTTSQDNHLRTLIAKHYTPAESLRDADFSATTAELHSRFQASFPVLNFSLDDVYQLMLDLGYEMVDRTEMEFVWVLKSK